MPVEKIAVVSESVGQRIDRFLANLLASRFSRTAIKKLILEGKVTVDGKSVKPNFVLNLNQEIQAALPEKTEIETRAENIPIEIVYEDEDCIVVNKPAGMVVHPASGNLSGTLVNALLFHTEKLSKIGGAIRSGIVHRLDKDTSGLLLVAKNDWAHAFLAKQFKAHKIERAYVVAVKGVVEHEEMRCEAPLGRSPAHRKKIVVQKEGGCRAVTNFNVLKRFKTATLLEARPETGRTHQIRVHLRHLGYPVLGDKEYGYPSPLISRQALHARTLAFVHPKTGKPMRFDSDLPPDLARLIKQLEK